MNDRLLKIGELAEKTGLTNRTIRYYDELDLLKPTKRSRSGYRLYGRDELERLQKIRSLKFIGLQLEEIKECLEDEDYNLEKIIYRQMKQVRTEIELGKELYSRLKTIANLLKSSEDLSTEELLKTLNTMTKYEKYYTKDQLEYLEKRKQKLGEERIKEVQQEWKELIAEVRTEMEKDTDPNSEKMQELAARWEELIQEFTGGNKEIRKSLSNMYSNEDTEEASHGYVDNETMQFISKAMKKAD
ncbi:MerR family transcriptional regulator [Fodinibius salsisoli]|uniref:MerR family transcriptional regulator n=1 Tax=Fodinibius salsisoli TaxID=2820877 RepID=A0ABT3PSL2_9BACT|nr:MerR family transcriptional regulator [Fodinibius salsisoli]MCW9708853.1 MerR family transcriptional regulator [Fodinibius salsisoli]